MRAAQIGTIAALLCLAMPHTALATDYPALKITLVGNADLPVVGQSYSTTLRVSAAESITIDGVAVDSDGSPFGGPTTPDWQVVSFNPPVPFTLTPGQDIDIPIQIIPSNPSGAVFFEFDIGGITLRRDLFLLPPVDQQVVFVNSAKNGVDWPLEVDESFARPAPLPKPDVAPRDVAPRDRVGMTVDSAQDEGESVLTKTPGIYTISGSFLYTRRDGLGSGADGVTVTVWDEDLGADDVLAQTVTDPQGNFYVQFAWAFGGEPDIYLQLRAGNGKVQVELPMIGEPLYQWFTSTRWNAGPTQTYNGMYPGSNSHYPVLHILTMLSRAWRWNSEKGFGGIDQVDVLYPDSDWPHYSSNYEEIYIPTGWKWDDGILLHEYGHHWVDQFADSDGTDYCNTGGRCDTADDCRHCYWCEETALDAWREGYPDWLSSRMGRDFEFDYEHFNGTPLEPLGLESMVECAEVDDFDDPYKTEGFLAALLRDIDDNTNETDPGAPNLGGADKLSWGATAILNLVDAQAPRTPAEFLGELVAAYPGDLQKIWFTAANNGYQIDGGKPGIVTGLVSTSHSTAGDSPDGTIDFDWTTATDDMSGVDGYSIWASTGGPAFPNAVKNIEALPSSYTTGELGPGVWWFNIRAVDHAGNWSNNYAAYGPVTIRDPYPADLAIYAGPDFDYQCTPRNTTGAPPAPLTNLLNGDLTNTYFNMRLLNTGELATNSSFSNTVLVDGVVTHVEHVFNFFPVGAGATRTWTNEGPYAIRGGRHTVEWVLDSGESLPEDNESDNYFNHEFVWRPWQVDHKTTPMRERPAPPDAHGGKHGGILQNPNTDGVWMDLVNVEFGAMVLRNLDNTEDYDIANHISSTGPEDGFDLIGMQGISARGAGCLDVTLVKPTNVPWFWWDVSIMNFSGGVGNYALRQLDSEPLAVGSPQALTLPAGEYARLFHFSETQTVNGAVMVDVHVDPINGPVQMAVYGPDFTRGGLEDAVVTRVTDENGDAGILVFVSADTWGLLVWQDPKDVPAAKADIAVPFTVNVRSQLPDVAPQVPAGWAAALVPRNAADGTLNSVPLPTQLDGNVATTHFNTAFRNQAFVSAPEVDNFMYLDGQLLFGQTWFDVPGAFNLPFNGPQAINVRGGRHTTAMHLDPFLTLDEENNANNSWGSQWVWSPLQLAYDTSVLRPAPPDPVGDMDVVDIDFSGPFFFNCDGLRAPGAAPVNDDGWWVAVAAMPGASSDVDLRLHHRVDTPLFGFDTLLTSSTAEIGALDYVLVDYRSAGLPQQFDVGAVGFSGTEGYSATSVTSTFLGTDPAGVHGSFTLAGGELIDLHEVYLSAGSVGISAVHESGDVDWGVSVHRNSLPYQSRNVTLPGGIAVENPAGADETVNVIIEESGYYCVAVWKASAADLANTGQYSLVFGQAIAIPDDVAAPRRTAIFGVYPNPFNPRTSIRFELSLAGPVQLDIYDVRGAHVRTLLRETLEPGAHECVWDGLDGENGWVSSGVYYARLKAAGAPSVAKLVLLK